MTVDPIPAGYHCVTPYLAVTGANEFIEFLKQAFEAEEIMRLGSPDGTIRHAEVRIGDSPIMLTESCDRMPALPCVIHLYVSDVDATYHRAIQAGAVSEQEPMDQFYGDRSGGVRCPFGVRWYMATHVEDVSPEEIARRMKAFEQGS